MAIVILSGTDVLLDDYYSTGHTEPILDDVDNLDLKNSLTDGQSYVNIQF